MSQELVQLLIVADGELEMAGNDAGLLVVTGSIACKLENFGCKIFEDGCEVDWSTCEVCQIDVQVMILD